MTHPGYELLARGGVPVVLAPMAGITNRAFRRLAREHARAATDGAATGIYVTEMTTSRALLERNEESLRLIETDPDESPRSVQLYGVDPATVAAAVHLLVDEDRADHIDLNFGCPVPKVTRKGGGSALPWKRGLFRSIVRSAVTTAAESARVHGREPVPVTVKMRVGVDDEHITYLEAGRAAAEEGAAWVALHGRTASQLYGGTADWSTIARLVEELEPYGVPVLGNGDIWVAADALRMVDETGCDGVVVGRGCLGRPWLFGDLARAFAGEVADTAPPTGVVVEALRDHARRLADWHGDEVGVKDIRKHVGWYLQGYPVGPDVRRRLVLAEDLAAFEAVLDEIDPAIELPVDAVGLPRGHQHGPKPITVPEGFWDDRDSPALLGSGADAYTSGG